MASKKELKLVEGENDTDWHIIPATYNTLNVGVNVPQSGFAAYPDTVQPISLITWHFYWKPDGSFAIISDQIDGKRYFFQTTVPPENKVNCIGTTAPISTIMSDPKNIFNYIGANQPYSFTPKLLPTKYVQFLNPQSLYMVLSDNQLLATKFYLNSSDNNPQPFPPNTGNNKMVVGAVAVAMVALLIGFIAYKTFNEK